jgi:SAM-dependent methyltransferase
MRAYARYYTHNAGPSAACSGRGLKVALRNGYLHARWGYDGAPSLALGRWFLGRRRRAALDLEVRHLPRPEGRARLLDVGCGMGAFLATMKARGWEVHGLEPDPAAAAAARAVGIDVRRGTLVDADWPGGSFQAVTMSSVIEHVHDPAEDLAVCRRLLAPGGLIHIVTPNIDALGDERFGRHWRGLEAPRHLVLFNRGSLARLLDACGFEDVTFHPHYAAEWFWLASGAIERRLAPEAARELPREVRRSLRREGKLADRRVAREPDRAEELVVTARRPGPGA